MDLNGNTKVNKLKQIQQYRENSAVSQSFLKSILSNKPFRKESLAMTLGNYLDCALLLPEHIKDLYYIADIERPTQTILDLCNSLYQYCSSPNLDLYEHQLEIEDWIQTQDYYKNRPKTRVKKFIEEAYGWWTVLVGKGEKEIITSVEQLDNELICMRLKADPELDWLWQGEFQKDFYWTEEEIGCKGLGDICLEDAYIDLKYTTCTNLKDWIKVCCSLNYPFQMAFYKSGLGFKKGYWLVTNKEWHQLIPVSDLMFNIGKSGYRKREVVRTGDMELDIIKKTPGYLDALNLLKGEKEKTIEQLYLENL